MERYKIKNAAGIQANNPLSRYSKTAVGVSACMAHGKYAQDGNTEKADKKGENKKTGSHIFIS